MNSTEIHLALNHIPVLGSFFAFILLAFGIGMKKDILKKAGLIVMIIAGLTAIPVDKSGENAEHIVEEYPGVSHDQIHEHEEMAESAIPLSIACSIFAALALYFNVKEHPRARISALLVLILALTNFIMMAQVANEGGKIRRPDLRQEVDH